MPGKELAVTDELSRIKGHQLCDPADNQDDLPMVAFFAEKEEGEILMTGEASQPEEASNNEEISDQEDPVWCT